MSSENLGDRPLESNTNPNLKSSIVHKPFATGTVNFFNPHRQKSDNSERRSALPKLFLNAQLEETNELPDELSAELTLESAEIEHHDRPWLNVMLNFWSLSAIAIIFLTNLISSAVIWRNYRLTANSNVTEPKPLTTSGSANLADSEFVPLNLSTLSRLKTVEDLAESSPTLTPISPALAPINNAIALSAANSEYYYVLTEYTGDRSLALAREKVPQVSLVNFPQGVFIYLGAFRDRDLAEQFRAQLEPEGFAVQIYPFE